MKKSSTRQLVYLVQTRDHALHQASYSAAAFVLVALCWGLHSSQFIVGALILVGVYFLCGASINWLAHMRHKLAIQAGRVGASVDVDIELTAADETVQEIDLGANSKIIRFIYSNKIAESHGDCIKRIRESITSDKDAFAKRFADFRASTIKKYPKYANFLSELEIQVIRVLRANGTGQCLASVRFAGGVGEVWTAQYTGESFSELIWI
jgi:hypothetical protein